MDYFDYNSASKSIDESEIGEIDIEEFLESSQSQEIERILDQIEAIDDQLGQRDNIHDETLADLNTKLEWYLERLSLLYKRGGSRDEKDELKDRIELFYEEIREEKRSHWRDTQNLENERRKLERERQEVESSFDDLFPDRAGTK